ncbi:MAG: class I SAM-dependent methyltransferase [Pseudomonadota bacterium]
MNLPRRVLPETLDQLAASDPLAVRSRADLRRINRLLGTHTLMLRALSNGLPAPRHIIELGAGDGTLMLTIARKMAVRWPAVHLTLLDRQHLVSAQTISAFAALGWQADILAADVHDWLKQASQQCFDLVLANLFMHHFHNHQLAPMLAAIAQRCQVFFACEPRRTWLPLAGSHLIGLIGANAVTRADAVLSVHAGFCRHELTALWPGELRHAWILHEYPARLFSHCFHATRRRS